MTNPNSKKSSGQARPANQTKNLEKKTKEAAAKARAELTAVSDEGKATSGQTELNKDELTKTVKALVLDGTIDVGEVDATKKLLTSLGASDQEEAKAVLEKLADSNKEKRWQKLLESPVQEKLPLSGRTLPDEHTQAALLEGLKYLKERPALDIDYQVSAGEFDNPFDLKLDAWRRIFQNNQLLSGIDLDRREPRRAFKTALQLTCEPTFMASDGSNVDYAITYTAEAHARVLSKFDKHEATFSSPMVSGSVEVSTRERTASLRKKKQVYKTGQWNFPRVILRLDGSNVEPTKEFKACIESALAQENEEKQLRALLKVFKDYGHAWATEVTLGGQLYYVDEQEDTEHVDEREFEKQVKATVTAQYEGMSGSYARTMGEKREERDEGAEGAQSKTWFATGGNALLAADPGQWTPTVGPYENWRVIHLKGIRPLYELACLTGDQLNQIEALREQREIPPHLEWEEIGTEGNKKLLPPLKSVAVQSEHRVVLVGKDQQAWAWQPAALADNNWTKLPGSALQRASVGRDGTIWAINKDNNLFDLSGGQIRKAPGDGFEQVSVLDRLEVWSIRNGNVVADHNDQYTEKTLPSGKGLNISVAFDGTVWVVSDSGLVFNIDGSSFEASLVASPEGVFQFQKISARTAEEIWGIATDSEAKVWRAVKWEPKINAVTWVGTESQPTDQDDAMDISVSQDGAVWLLLGTKLYRLKEVPAGFDFTPPEGNAGAKTDGSSGSA